MHREMSRKQGHQLATGPEDVDRLKKTSLYNEFECERNEILRHKWYLSEKAGHDIGFETALTDWMMNHRSKWRKSRRRR